MRLHEKIKNIRQEKGLSLKELHRLITNDFKEGAITYRTLQRIEAGDTDGKGSSLHQISTALGVTLSELKKDTEEETRPVDLIKRNKRLGRYVFNEKVYADLLIRQNRNFMAQELVLKPQGKTRLEQDLELNLTLEKSEQIKQILKSLNWNTEVLEDYKILKFEKYVYCLKGKIACYIGKDKYKLGKGDGVSFESSTPHWFENISKKESRCLIFQNPRYL
ncbi:helix-turn-helix transcriptional regulator [Candidatus Gottesmanbacteria bacterium]|nr:helix-turn-helix transcriptional regulator [Candidatus Gottesmanbacteria bacterium]